ncbi:MAG: triosephosphate isomerase [Alphaproteobacteria bacterium]|jgi:triosephosphate isomerase
MAIRPLIAGNWKMNGLRAGAIALATGIVDTYEDGGEAACDVLVCPPFLHLQAVSGAIEGSAVFLGGQDCHDADSGAHTGDVSAAMLRDVGCRYCIVGHSERRADHGEDDAVVRAKAAAVHREGLIAIICVGETLAEREGGTTLEIVESQLRGSVPEGATAENTIVAYEPVWAIGTGLTPSLEQVGEVHDDIRSVLADIVGQSENVRILYGGSMNPGNARDILALANVNGGLVGGASLKIDDFSAIIQSCG